MVGIIYEFGWRLMIALPEQSDSTRVMQLQTRRSRELRFFGIPDNLRFRDRTWPGQ
jgi:hypothetical protein